MKITEKADKNLKDLFGKKENAGKILRVFLNGFGWGGPRFGIALDGQKKSDDETVEKVGYTIAFESRLKGYLEDATIDFRKSFMGESGFTVLSDCCWNAESSMTLFDFKCGRCGREFEEFLAASATANPPCPACGAPETQKLFRGFNLGGSVSAGSGCASRGGFTWAS